ncbi:hypothetical protein LIP_1999 [Limnochorda pilosa]|uniref:Uncharacterized protein n=1 Tax=Limnochorda pilosa TaxID=1555112 RepID=A0A0K2SL62_LIMPI|nr:hypothetical protein LIP_1999 [Limnochorda pilosa]
MKPAPPVTRNREYGSGAAVDPERAGSSWGRFRGPESGLPGPPAALIAFSLTARSPNTGNPDG